MKAFALATLAAALLGAAPAAGAPPAATATLDACHSASLQANRYATFGALMRTAAAPGASTMEVRFQLLERTPRSPLFRAVAAPGLGVWQQSAPGIGLFRASQEVAGLAAPASFRTLVTFRWLAADHSVLRSARRLSPICRIPDERPNLVVGRITQPDPTTYVVVVRNNGLGPAGPFAVRLTVGTVTEPDVLVAGLASGGRTTVRFKGPPCTTGAVTVVVDTNNAVNETTKADNTAMLVCA
jgi:hypothetical protein